jgi:hypothetical protein
MTANARIVAVTQIEENYGAHAWNGLGTCPQRWKFKGGNDVVIWEGQPESAPFVVEGLKKAGFKYLERNDPYWKEYVIDVRILAPGEKTEDEKMKEWEESRGY